MSIDLGTSGMSQGLSQRQIYTIILIQVITEDTKGVLFV
jgi:hypothetical protein